MSRPASPARGGVLAIDHGDRHTGFAYSDALGITTRTLDTYHGPSSASGLLDHIAQLRAERDIATFVVGLPLNADGSENPRCQVVRAFAAQLRARFPEVGLALLDEHLTSKAAEDRLAEVGLGGRRGRAQRDAYSALILLEDWLRLGSSAPDEGG